MAPRDGVRDGGTMGSVKRKQVRGRRARRAAPAPCLPGTRAMGLREVADGVRWPDGHAAPRGAPAPLVPRHVAAGEVEEGRVRPRARRPGGGLGEGNDLHARAPARRPGGIGVPPTCRRAGSGRTTSSWPRGTGRGGAGRRGPRTGSRRSRRQGAARAGAGAAPPGSSRTAGARRGASSRPGTSTVFDSL